MFTGIVEEFGTIEAIEDQGDAIRLTIASDITLSDAGLGDSIAVNGCCLTVVKARGRGGSKVLEFDLLDETWRRTSLRHARIGSAGERQGRDPLAMRRNRSGSRSPAVGD